MKKKTIALFMLIPDDWKSDISSGMGLSGKRQKFRI